MKEPRITFVADEEIKEKLLEISKEKDMSVSAVIRTALKFYFQKEGM